MRLTIGFPTYDDYHGLEMSIQSLQLYHDLTGVELIVVDNQVDTRRARKNKRSPAERLQHYCGQVGARYIPLPEPVGTAAPRDKIFDEARGDVVIVCDSHVMLGVQTLPAIRKYFTDPVNEDDILHGPMLHKHRRADGRLATAATHYEDKWRSSMWGVWAVAWRCKCGTDAYHFHVCQSDPRPKSEPLQIVDGAIIATPQQPDLPTITCEFYRVGMGQERLLCCPECGADFPVGLDYANHYAELTAAGYAQRCDSGDDTEPFAVPGMGLGMFAMRKDAWPGFTVGMVGFGGGELHLHELVRRNGGRSVCHPLCPWWHRFERDRVPYATPLWHKVRNYVLWRNRLGMDLQPVHDHFVGNRELKGGSLTEEQWGYLLESPLQHVEFPKHLAPPVVAGRRTANGRPDKGRPQPPADAATFAAVYDWTRTTKRDCIDHLPTIKKMAAECETVVGLVKRREWDAAVLAGAPTVYHSYNTEPDPLHDRLAAIAVELDGQPAYTVEHVDSLQVAPVPCDMLVIDTVHTAERLRAELDRWAGSVSRWIVLRGTKAFGEHAEGSKQPGLLVAAREFMQRNPHWKRVAQEDAQYGLTVLSRDPNERTIDRGPGYELHKIFDQLGVQMQANCSCRARIAQMNAWGPAGCLDHLDEIVSALKKDQDKYSWGVQFKAAIGTLKTGLIARINPLDPLRGFVKEAIRRAQAEDDAWEKRQAT